MPHSGKLFRAVLTAAALSTLCVLGASAACEGAGTVTADGGLRLRSGAGTDSTILATASKGENVVILDDAGNGWYKVNWQGLEGYMSGEYLTVSSTADVSLGSGKVTTEGSTLNVRSGPGTGYDRVTSLNDGAVVSIVGVDNGWYKISTGSATGYVSGDYLTPCSDGQSTGSTLGQQIVSYAKGFLGTPYVYGGNGPSCFDCSGFTKYVYSHFGYSINRGATSQLSNGVKVSRSELQPGDLIFFNNGSVSGASHVGIYIGNGQFIHASTNQYKVQINNLDSGYYSRVYIGARRVI